MKELGEKEAIEFIIDLLMSEGLQIPANRAESYLNARNWIAGQYAAVTQPTPLQNPGDESEQAKAD